MFRPALRSAVVSIALAATAVRPSPCRAQTAPEHAIASNPSAPTPVIPVARRDNALQLDLGLAVVGLAYERVLGDHFALQIEGHLFGTWFWPYFGLPNFTGGGVQLRPTLFPFGHAPRGLYIAPFVRAESVTAPLSGDVTGAGFGFSTGAWIGYSLVIARVVDVRIGVGAQYMSYRASAGGAVAAANTFFPGLDLLIGWMF